MARGAATARKPKAAKQRALAALNEAPLSSLNEHNLIADAQDSSAAVPMDLDSVPAVQTSLPSSSSSSSQPSSPKNSPPPGDPSASPSSSAAAVASLPKPPPQLDESRGCNARRGYWITLNQAWNYAGGLEWWTFANANGEVVPLPNDNRSKPIWRYEQGSKMYLGSWEKAIVTTTKKRKLHNQDTISQELFVESGLGVCFIEPTPARNAELYSGPWSGGLRTGQGRCFTWPVLPKELKMLVQEQQAKEDYNVAKNFMGIRRKKKIPLVPFEYVGEFVRDLKQDRQGVFTLQDGVKREAVFNHDKPSWDNGQLQPAELSIGDKNKSASTLGPLFRHNHVLSTGKSLVSKHAWRGYQSRPGRKISLLEAKGIAEGKEWWLTELDGQSVTIPDDDKLPVWLYNDGDMYLGAWADRSDKRRVAWESGFGIAYRNLRTGLDQGLQIYIGNWDGGLPHGHGRSLWANQHNEPPCSALWYTKPNSSPEKTFVPYEYLGLFVTGRKKDDSAIVTLQDGTKLLGKWKNDVPSKEWWAQHVNTMQVEARPAMKDDEHCGVARKVSLEESKATSRGIDWWLAQHANMGLGDPSGQSHFQKALESLPIETSFVPQNVAASGAPSSPPSVVATLPNRKPQLGARGSNARPGSWITLNEAWIYAGGIEWWTFASANGEVVSLPQNDKPIWRYEYGQMYLGSWEKVMVTKTKERKLNNEGTGEEMLVESGLGVCFLGPTQARHSAQALIAAAPNAEVYAGPWRGGLRSGQGRCFTWPLHPNVTTDLLQEQQAKKDNNVAENFMGLRRNKTIPLVPFEYVGMFVNDLKQDHQAVITLQDGIKCEAVFNCDRPSSESGKLRPMEQATSHKNDSASTLGPFFRHHHTLSAHKDFGPKHGWRGYESRPGRKISLKEAKCIAEGREWWLVEIDGQSVTIPDDDHWPVWLYNNGDMYLGAWFERKKKRRSSESGFGIAYRNLRGGKDQGLQIYIGNWEEGYPHGRGRSLWVNQHDEPSRSALCYKKSNSSPEKTFIPYEYLGLFAKKGLKHDDRAQVTLQDGTKLLGAWNYGAPAGSWWARHVRTMLVEARPAMKDDEHLGVARKISLEESKALAGGIEWWLTKLDGQAATTADDPTPVFLFNGGDLYLGSWHYDKMTGQGWPSGFGVRLYNKQQGSDQGLQIHVGDWENGVPHGRGRSLWVDMQDEPPSSTLWYTKSGNPNKKICVPYEYLGLFVNGRKHASSARVTLQGRTNLLVPWRNDLPHGYWWARHVAALPDENFQEADEPKLKCMDSIGYFTKDGHFAMEKQAKEEKPSTSESVFVDGKPIEDWWERQRFAKEDAIAAVENKRREHLGGARNISLEESKALAGGIEWWLTKLDGQAATTPDDPTPVWLYNNSADMYLGSWHSDNGTGQGWASGFGVAFYNMQKGPDQGLQIHIGDWENGVPHGRGRSLWSAVDKVISSALEERKGLKVVPVAYEYLGLFEKGLKDDLNAWVTLPEGTELLVPWEHGVPAGNWWAEHVQSKEVERGSLGQKGHLISLEESKEHAQGMEWWTQKGPDDECVVVPENNATPVLLYCNGNMYIGEWGKDKGGRAVEMGFGIAYIHKKGVESGRQIHVGNWSHGSLHGRGRVLWVGHQEERIWTPLNGMLFDYIGSFRNGIRHDNEGIAILQDGAIRQGPWKDGIPHGWPVGHKLLQLGRNEAATDLSAANLGDDDTNATADENFQPPPAKKMKVAPHHGKDSTMTAPHGV